MTRMDMGFGAPVSGSWATPANLRDLGRAAERLGYRTLWSFQRVLFPAGDPIPVVYRAVHDPLAVSAYLAGVTDRIRLGIAIVNAPFYSPAVLAKTLTSIDALSDGRLDAGLGLGWSADEFAAAGVDMARRGARTEDFIAALRAMWGANPVEYDGEFYRVPRSLVDPKPTQQPHPPLYLGGTAPAALARAGRLADGWISSSRFEPAQLPEAIGIVRAGAADAGRDPDAVRIVIRGSVKVRAEDTDAPLTATLATLKRQIASYADFGVDEFFVDLNFDEEIGSPDADPAESVRRAHEALEAFAPAT